MFKTSMISKSTMLATIVALVLASISATSVFAASTISTGTTPNATVTAQNLTSDWKAELQTLHEEEFTAGLINKWYANWLKTDSKVTTSDKNFAIRHMDTYTAKLQLAEQFAASHTGFSNAGAAMDNVKAQQSVDTLSNYLHDLHMILVNQVMSIF